MIICKKLNKLLFSRDSQKEVKERRSKRWRGERQETKVNAYMTFAVRLDESKLLYNLVGLELLPPAVHQGLGSDLILHQALCSQADGAALRDCGGHLQVCVSYSLQKEW